MTDLRTEAAEALLKAIIKEAPSAASRGTDALESLARAYALTVEGSPKMGGARLR